METLNLNIHTYSLDDLYGLFHIPLDQELTEPILKDAKRMVLKTHPDKSHLDSKFFIFFSKAYKILYSLYKQHGSSNETVQYTSLLDNNVDKNEQNYLSRFFEKNPQLKRDATKFNAWFNREFSQCSDLLYETEPGYGEWFRSDQEIPTEQITRDNFQSYKHHQINKQSPESLAIQPFLGNPATGSMLGDPTVLTTYDNALGLGGSDLKHAYSETVIPVSESMMQSHVHKSVQSYKHQRDKMDTTPLSKHESENMLKQERMLENKDGMKRAYYYETQLNQMQTNKQLFWRKMKQIKN